MSLCVVPLITVVTTNFYETEGSVLGTEVSPDTGTCIIALYRWPRNKQRPVTFSNYY